MFRNFRAISSVNASLLALTASMQRPVLSRTIFHAKQFAHIRRGLVTRANGIQTGFKSGDSVQRSITHVAKQLCSRAQPYSSTAEVTEEEIIITESAAKRLNMLREDDEDLILRVEVDGGGCQGFQYNLKLETLADIDPEEDKVYKRDGATVVVDESSLETLKGSTIDYKTNLIGSAFCVGENPLADATCGCNRSFNIK